MALNIKLRSSSWKRFASAGSFISSLGSLLCSSSSCLPFRFPLNQLSPNSSICSFLGRVCPVLSCAMVFLLIRLILISWFCYWIYLLCLMQLRIYWAPSSFFFLYVNWAPSFSSPEILIKSCIPWKWGTWYSKMNTSILAACRSIFHSPRIGHDAARLRIKRVHSGWSAHILFELCPP